MNPGRFLKTPKLLPMLLAIAAVGGFGFWLCSRPGALMSVRVPGTDRGPESDSGTNANPVLLGKVTKGSGQPATLPGAWTHFRGSDGNAISKESLAIAPSWEGAKPRELWSIDLGEGYAGAAVTNGCVYVMDYDATKKEDALRCLSLGDGQEIWRFSYPVSIKRNHGMTRTVPALSGNCVVAIGPKCHVICVDASSGELRWGADLARDYGATIPPWYCGQCPLIDGDKVILAPGGPSALLVALDLATGKLVWQTPNPRAWKMTHSSIMPFTIGAEQMYVYCANNGVVGVSARDGRLLWESLDWKISIATVPSPLILPGGKVFLSGGYDAGSLMLQIEKTEDRFVARPLFKLDAGAFGATQHTPIFYDNHIYGVRADGKFVCLDLQGKVIWTSDSGQSFGLGSFIIADGKLLAMNDTGLLRLIEARPDKFHLLGEASILHGRESWGPLAIAGGRLLARDFTRMVCLEVGK